MTQIVREFSSAGPCLTLGRLTKETPQFYCYDEWKGNYIDDSFARLKDR